MAQSADLTRCDQKGSEYSLYLNVGTCETPVWIYHKGVVGDLTLNETEDENELSNRDPEQLVKQYAEGKISLSIEGTEVVDPDYEGFVFLGSMRSGADARDVMFLTGYISEVGNVGWRGKMRNFNRSITGPADGAGTRQFSLKPSTCVTTACKVRPVITEEGDTIADYEPGYFAPT